MKPEELKQRTQAFAIAIIKIGDEIPKRKLQTLSIVSYFVHQVQLEPTIVQHAARAHGQILFPK